jgi:hypothetical protein
VNGALSDRPAVHGRSSAALQLEHAKKSYLTFSSKLAPAWKEQTTLKKMNTLKVLQQEKEDAERRRLVCSLSLFLSLISLSSLVLSLDRNHYII